MSDGAAGGVQTRVFLSGVSSATHLVHIASYLRHLLADQGRSHVTVVDLGASSFLGAARVSAAEVDAGLPSSARLSILRPAGARKWRGEVGEDLIYLAVGAPGVKPLARLWLENRRQIRCVTVDEGLGSYGTWRTHRAAARREGSTALRAVVKAAVVATVKRSFVHDHWSLYRRTAQGWSIEELVAQEFRRQTGTDSPARQPGVVVLSQPWVELNQMTADRYVAVLQDVVAACADAGLSAVIRPHPVEDVRRFHGLPVGTDRGPAELDRSVTAADAVLGFSSTALVNLVALHHMPVLRLSVPELDPLDEEMSRDQRSLMTAFLPFPLPIDELAAALRALPSRAPGEVPQRERDP